MATPYPVWLCKRLSISLLNHVCITHQISIMDVFISRQVSRSPHSKHSQRRHSPYSSVDSKRYVAMKSLLCIVFQTYTRMNKQLRWYCQASASITLILVWSVLTALIYMQGKKVKVQITCTAAEMIGAMVHQGLRARLMFVSGLKTDERWNRVSQQSRCNVCSYRSWGLYFCFSEYEVGVTLLNGCI